MLTLHCVLKNNYSMSEVVTVAQSTMFALSDVVAVLTMGRIQNNGPGGSVPTGILIGRFALLMFFFLFFFIFLFFLSGYPDVRQGCCRSYCLQGEETSVDDR